MKKTVSLVILIALVCNCAYKLPQYEYIVFERKDLIIIDERVGETIDAGEGEQFGLFTGIGEFKETRFFAIENGGYVVEIATESDNLVAMSRDQDALMILREYIDTYEAISTDPTAFENKWGILDYDTLGIPITENEIKLAIKRSQGRAIKNGCSGCAFVSGFGLILAGMCVGSGGVPVGVAIGARVLAAGVVIGLITGITIYKRTYKEDPGMVLKAIKEARKPRVVE